MPPKKMSTSPWRRYTRTVSAALPTVAASAKGRKKTRPLSRLTLLLTKFLLLSRTPMKKGSYKKKRRKSKV